MLGVSVPDGSVSVLDCDESKSLDNSWSVLRVWSILGRSSYGGAELPNHPHEWSAVLTAGRILVP